MQDAGCASGLQCVSEISCKTHALAIELLSTHEISKFCLACRQAGVLGSLLMSEQMISSTNSVLCTRSTIDTAFTSLWLPVLVVQAKVP